MMTPWIGILSILRKQNVAKLLVFIMAICLAMPSNAQKVGIVLSGGGARGMAHIGFLKALEENNIPIDFIAGTSSGALVGGLYASGYSPEEIEAMTTSEEFEKIVRGYVAEEYAYFFKDENPDASWVTIKLSPKDGIEENIPTNVKNSTSFDYALMELLAPYQSVYKNDFDSLMVPFRCVTSDIIKKVEVVLDEGDLASAIRASMSYPFYLKPVRIDGVLLYDGGLYDNFPSKVLCNEFGPDIILGCNVSGNFPEPEEDNLISQLKVMLSNNQKYSIDCTDGVVVEPDISDRNLFDFTNTKEIVDRGYQSTVDKLPDIKSKIERRVPKDALLTKRNQFRQKRPEVVVDSVEISGLSKSQTDYVQSIMNRSAKSGKLSDLKRSVMRVASEDYVNQVYPSLMYKSNTGNYLLELDMKEEKPLFLSFGGNIASSPINQGFAGIQYHIFSKTPIIIGANAYFGQFYTSGKGSIRVDFSSTLPLYFEISGLLNKWDYFRNDELILETNRPSYLIYKDSYFRYEFGLPINRYGKFSAGYSFGELRNEYYQSNDFTRFDTTDLTRFTNSHTYVQFERNSFNRKQYEDEGSRLYFKAALISGKERTTGGSRTPVKETIEQDLEFFRLEFSFNKYFNKRGKIRPGILIEGLYSDQPFFSNYTATILNTKEFAPITETKTLFIEEFRAHKYVAGGAKLLYTPFRNFTIRTEGYVFQAVEEIVQNDQQEAVYRTADVPQHFVTSVAATYELPFGMVAGQFNYYNNISINFLDESKNQFSFLIHFGYVLFNRKIHD